MSKSEQIKDILKKIEETKDVPSQKLEEGILGDLIDAFRSEEGLKDKHRRVVSKYWKKRTVEQMEFVGIQIKSATKIVNKLTDPKKNSNLYKQILEMIEHFKGDINLLLTYIENWKELEVPSRLSSSEKEDLEDAAEEEEYEDDDDEEEEVVIRRGRRGRRKKRGRR